MYKTKLSCLWLIAICFITGSATATNYLTLTSAISDMTSGMRADGGTPNVAGVSDAVVLYTKCITKPADVIESININHID